MNNSSEKFELQEQLEKFVADSDLRDKINEQLKVDNLLKEHGLEAIKHVSVEQLIDSHNFDDAWASYYLGMMYLYGIKVEQDKEKAIKILKIAAFDKKHSLALQKYNELVERKPEIEELRKEVEILKQAKSHETFVNYLNNYPNTDKPAENNKKGEKIMGQDLHWQILSKPFNDEDIIIDDRELSNDPIYDVLHNPRKGLDALFGSNVTDDKDEEAIFVDAFYNGSYGYYDILTLKELIEKSEDKRFYEARKKFIDEYTRTPGRYEEIIQVIKSFEKFGPPEEIGIGLMIC